jgi:hypothetical protein
MAGPSASCGGGAGAAGQPVEPTTPPPQEQAAGNESGQIGWGEWWKEGDSACPPGSVLRQSERAIRCARANVAEDGDKLGQPHGRGVTFHENGSKAAEGTFEDGMHGPWTYWDETGQQVKVEHYEHGILRRIEYTQGAQGYKEAIWLLCNSVLLSGARQIKDRDQARTTNASWIETIIENPQAKDMLAALDPSKPIAMQKRIEQEARAEGIPQCPLLEDLVR